MTGPVEPSRLSPSPDIVVLTGGHPWHLWVSASAGANLRHGSGSERSIPPMSIVDFPVSTCHSRMESLLTGDPLEQFGSARRCAAEHCAAVLSRYKPAATCGVHRGWLQG